VYNSQWLEKLDFGKLMELTSRYTVARMLERDDFALRYKDRQPITILEFLYPLIQGYDSVIIKSDVEIGGTDQKFNLLVGRDLQNAYGQEQQVVITMSLLEGTDGSQKMSKSLGNYIGIEEPPKDMFGKVMSIPDELMLKYYELLTDIPEKEISGLKDGLKDGQLHPKVVKKKLAFLLTSMYHDEKSAILAREEFERAFEQRGLPQDIPLIEIPSQELKNGKIWLVKLLVLAKMASSNNDARRLIEQKAVEINQRIIADSNAEIEISGDITVKSGKKRFARIVVK
ncbi:MAG: tyrosine--tRNA ligase, partial [Candidatus Omnitrophica bacterium]|nr:tyrosine--tRNA ligase [Candidatus Omnitrophota bacterium]